MLVICRGNVPVSKPFHAICSKLTPTQGALRSGHQWSDAGAESPEAPAERRTAGDQLNENSHSRLRGILDTGYRCHFIICK